MDKLTNQIRNSSSGSKGQYQRLSAVGDEKSAERDEESGFLNEYSFNSEAFNRTQQSNIFKDVNQRQQMELEEIRSVSQVTIEDNNDQQEMLLDENPTSKKVIDFKQLFDKFREDTEANIPFTNMHIEDVIFTDQNHVVTLEYIFYQRENEKYDEPADYKALVYKANEKTQIVQDSDKDESPRPTNTSRFSLIHEEESIDVFGDDPIELQSKEENYLANFGHHEEEISSLQKRISGIGGKLTQVKETAVSKCNFMETDKKEALVEAYLGLYKINRNGQIQKEKQQQIHYDINFKPSRRNEMRLQLSQDKQFILLPYRLKQQDSRKTKKKSAIDIIGKMFGGKDGHFQSYDCLVWDSHELKSTKLNDKLQASLKNLPLGRLIDMNFIGSSQYFMVTIKRYVNPFKQSDSYMNWFIYNVQSGELELNISNNQTQQEKDEDCSANKRYRLMGILSKPHSSKHNWRKNKRTKNEFELTAPESFRQNKDLEANLNEQCDQLEKSDIDSQQSDENILKTDRSLEDETKDIEIKDKKKDIELTFLFAQLTEMAERKANTSLNSSRIQSKNDASANDDKTKENMMIWTKINVHLSDIKKNSTFKGELHYLNHKAQTKFNQYDDRNPQFKMIPKAWFVNEKNKGKDVYDKNWEGSIYVSSNRNFNQFGFLNKEKQLYLAYEFNENSGNQSYMASQQLPKQEQSQIYHGRNQYTKEHLYLIIRMRNEDTTTICFEENNKKTKIKFANDHENALQDVIHQGCPTHKHKNKKAQDQEEEQEHGHQEQNLDDDEDYIFQSVTLSRNDQEILFKTNRIKYTEKGSSQETINRKTISQHFQYMYPVFCYNIGMYKLIIQNTLGDGIMYIHEFPLNEQFISFVEFNNFKDIGFELKENENQIAGNSHFAFVIFDQLSCCFQIQLLFVDTNRKPPSFKLYKSTYKVLASCSIANQDVVIKTIMYSTQKGNTDTDFRIKLLIQYPEHFTQNTLEKNESNDFKTVHAKQAQNDNEKDEDQNEEEEASGIVEKQTQVPILLDKENGFLYYIKTYAGMCRIYQILPKSDDEHMLVHEIKSSYCYGFSKNGSNFLFFDDEKRTNILRKENESPMLFEISERKMKDKDSPNFHKDEQALIVLKENYVIQKSKIFYQFEGQPLAAGILDMEEMALTHSKPLKDSDNYDAFPIKLNKGPYLFEETLEFGFIVRVLQDKTGKDDNSHEYKLAIRKLPDGKQQKIITDFTQKVDLATFITQEQDDRNDERGTKIDPQGQILIKLGSRFMIYDIACEFVNEVHFYENRKKPREKVLKQIRQDDQKDNDDTDADSDEGYETDSEYERENMIDSTETSSLRLHSISEDNKFFLFYKETVQRDPYSFINSPQAKQRRNSSLSSSQQKYGSPIKPEFQFADHNDDDNLTTVQAMVVFQLCSTGKYNRKKNILENIENRQMFKKEFEFNLPSNDNPLKKVDAQNSKDHQISVSIKNDGCIHIIQTYWINEQNQSNNPKGKTDEQKEKKQTLQIIGKFFTRCKPGSNPMNCDNSKVATFNQKLQQQNTFNKYTIEETVEFNIDEVQVLQKGLNNLIKIQNYLREREIKVQADLPKNFKDSSKLQSIEAHIQRLEEKKNNIVRAQIFGNYLIVRCAQQIKFKQIDYENHQKTNHNCKFESVNCDFDKDFDIYDILSTSVPNEFMIVARDEDKEVLIMQSWDFAQNIEASMLQYPIIGDQNPEFNVVKGMNMKRNYFQDQYYIFDLEFNIPLQSIPSLSDGGLNQQQYKYQNQRKIYKDSSISLSLDNVTYLNLAVNRMDLLFWYNICIELGEQTETIIQNTDLAKFNSVFDGYSMFHYFATKPEIISEICKKYQTKKEHNELREDEKNMPLLILHPNYEGKTALDLAVEAHRPKAFRYMIQLLEEVTENFCLSKLMLDIIPRMVTPGTFCYIEFFDSASFQPLIMREPMIIPWPNDMDEFIFASHTTLISKAQIIQAIEQQTGNTIVDEQSKSKQFEDKMNRQETQADDQTGLRSMKLEENNDDNQVNYSRVKLEALDFDWLFQDDNAKTFLEILTNLESSSIYAMQSIQILIKNLWSVYQPQILHKVFIPYMFYVFIFITLQPHIDSKIEDQGSDFIRILFFAQILTLLCLYIYFIQFEVKQFYENISGYFSEFTNMFDIFQYTLNAIIIFMFLWDYFAGNYILSDHNQKGAYAFACFLMWIKVYYMMRVFQDTAHFITLIQRIMTDIKTFTIMLFIVLFAFANFFYVIDRGDDSAKYLGRYVSSRVIDSLIEMYFIGLGEYNEGNYSKGNNSTIIWIGFILATFIVNIVFMNLLISIMGNTLEDVQTIQQEAQYQEQAEMINEFISLLDIEQHFKKCKYIIYVSKDTQSNELKDDVAALLNDFKQQLFFKNEINENNTAKKNENIEQSNRIVMKNLNSLKNQMNSQKTEIKKLQNLSAVRQNY